MKYKNVFKRITKNFLLIVIISFVMDKIFYPEQTTNEYIQSNYITIILFTTIFSFIDINKIFKKENKK